MFMNLFLLASEATEALVEAEHSGFGINKDIFSTNLINIVIILGVLFFAGRGFLGKILAQRLETIQTAIKDAERRKQEAMAKLADQQQKLTQAQVERDRLKAQSEASAKAAGEAILATVAADIERLKIAATQELATEQEKVVMQLRQQVTQKALAQVNAYFAQGLSESAQQQLVDRSIALLVSGAES